MKMGVLRRVTVPATILAMVLGAASASAATPEPTSAPTEAKLSVADLMPVDSPVTLGEDGSFQLAQWGPPPRCRRRPWPYYRGRRTHVDWCLRRYRSYNPRTNRFLGYDGRYHRCRSPYSR
ncbi:MAG: BA14K family protein [Breoghania sp.]|nr:BA14K family protein [Breoghania sp.]